MTHYLMRNTATQDLKLIAGYAAKAALEGAGWKLLDVIYSK